MPDQPKLDPDLEGNVSLPPITSGESYPKGSFKHHVYKDIKSQEEFEKIPMGGLFTRPDDPTIYTKTPPEKPRIQAKHGGSLLREVGGTGPGDKMDIKAESGEFVVSNAMLDSNPGLREQLETLRQHTLASVNIPEGGQDGKHFWWGGQLGRRFGRFGGRMGGSFIRQGYRNARGRRYISAYTPGKGDPGMEGGYETASGEPLYTYEAWKKGDADYVTAAGSKKGGNKNAPIEWVNINGEWVPTRATDYGPGIKGNQYDIAYENAAYAKNYPYQGMTRVSFGNPRGGGGFRGSGFQMGDMGGAGGPWGSGWRQGGFNSKKWDDAFGGAGQHWKNMFADNPQMQDYMDDWRGSWNPKNWDEGGHMGWNVPTDENMRPGDAPDLYDRGRNIPTDEFMNPDNAPNAYRNSDDFQSDHDWRGWDEGRWAGDGDGGGGGRRHRRGGGGPENWGDFGNLPRSNLSGRPNWSRRFGWMGAHNLGGGGINNTYRGNPGVGNPGGQEWGGYYNMHTGSTSLSNPYGSAGEQEGNFGEGTVLSSVGSDMGANLTSSGEGPLGVGEKDRESGGASSPRQRGMQVQGFRGGRNNMLTRDQWARNFGPEGLGSFAQSQGGYGQYRRNFLGLGGGQGRRRRRRPVTGYNFGAGSGG